MSTHFYYRLAQSIADSEMLYLDAQEKLDALYAMLSHAQESEARENERLKGIYGDVYKPIFSQWPERIDDLISRFRVDNQEELDRLEKVASDRDFEDSQMKVYH